MSRVYRRDQKYNMSWIDSMLHTKKTKKETIIRQYPVAIDEAFAVRGQQRANMYEAFSGGIDRDDYDRFHYYTRDYESSLGILDQIAKAMDKPKEEVKPKEYKETIPNSVACYLTSHSDGEHWSINTKSQGFIASIYKGPTWNCQIQSIAGMNQILEGYTTEQVIEILAHTWNNSNRKTELLVDIPEKNCEALELIFSPTDMLVKAPYINNTGTPMCIYILQIKNVLHRHNMIINEHQWSKELGRYIYV